MGGIFQTKIEGDPSFLSYLIQQLAVPLVPTLLALIVAGSLEDFTKAPGAPPQDDTALWVLACCASGFVCGFPIGCWLPNARAMGRLVWILPVFAFVAVFLLNSIQHGFVGSLADFFHPGPNGEAAWLAMLLTGPTCCAICYPLGLKVGATVQLRRRRPPAF
jgi:hypothetical protein